MVIFHSYVSLPEGIWFPKILELDDGYIEIGNYPNLYSSYRGLWVRFSLKPIHCGNDQMMRRHPEYAELQGYLLRFVVICLLK